MNKHNDGGEAVSDTPKLLALMAKSRDVNALDYSKQLEVLVRELERENAALRNKLAVLERDYAALDDRYERLVEKEAQP